MTPEASRAMLRRDLKAAAAASRAPKHPRPTRFRRSRGVMAGFAVFAVVGMAAAYLSPLGTAISLRASAEVTPAVTLYASALGDAQTVEVASRVTASPASLDRDSYGAVVKPRLRQNPVAVEGRAASFSVPFVAPNPGTAQAIAYDMVKARGWSDGEFSCLVALWKRESGWRVNAYNSGSGAYGIPQALPGSKMASAGADWATNPATQITWGLGYVSGRYGTPCGAWGHSQSTGWY